jgi:starch-binding outer membrane protein, SusD/RagB family
MKKLKYIFKKLVMIPVFLLGIILYSCEEIVELDPYNQVAETVAFADPALIELTVIGMYNAGQRGFFNGLDFRGYPFGSAFVQQGDSRGEDAVNLQAFYAFTYQGTYNTTTANNVFYWQDTWRLINRCNIVIDGVKKAGESGVLTDAAAKSYEGEARLLRAAAYHELLVNFARPYKHTADASHAGVPWHDLPYTSPEAVDIGFQKGRESVGFIYGKIVEDLDFAETHLPLRAARAGNAKFSRGTKGAAAAYKTRIYLHMYDWPKVVTEGVKFLTGGAYAAEYMLGDEPWTSFVNNYANQEYIYGMENSATNNPGVNAALASQYNRRQLVAISPILWRNSYWRVDDKRRKEGDMTLTRTSFTVSTTTGDTTHFKTIFTTKYKDVTNYTDASPMMRFAEVLLNLSEAYARLNDVPNALTNLNKVRDRALADKATQTYVVGDFADNVALLGAILAERRIELAMEGRRYPDIHRRQQDPHFPIAGVPGKLAQQDPIKAVDYVLGSEYSGPLAYAIPYDNFKFIWPIPLAELNANPTLAEQQNPGY